MAPPACFLSPLPTLPSRRTASPSPTTRPYPVCVLEERTSPIHVETPTRRRSSSPPTPPGVTPHNYQVLPDDVCPEELPPPPPVHYTLPSIGYLLELMFAPDWRYERARKLGGIYTTNGFLKRRHFVTDYNAITAMSKDSSTFLSRGASPAVAKLFGDKNLVNTDGPEHVHLRSALVASFSPNLMPFYFNVIRRLSSEAWEKLATSSAASEKVTLLDPFFRKLYLTNMIRVTTGMTYESENYAMFCEKFQQMFFVFLSPQVGPIYEQGMRAKEEMIQVFKQLLENALVEHAEVIERVRGYEDRILMLASREFPKGDVNFLIMYIADSALKTGTSVDENDPEDVKDLAEKIIGLWFAGVVTTGASSASASMILGSHPDIAAALRAEQDALVAKDGSLELTFDQLSKMPLLESFLYEVLRMYPISQGMQRIASRDAQLFGYLIAKGDDVWMDMITAMRDERYYPDPHTFKYDRFLRNDGKFTVPRVLSFAPVGSSHYCLGAQLAFVLLKTTFGSLLRRYTLELDPRQSQDWSYLPECVPKSGVKMTKLRRRDDI